MTHAMFTGGRLIAMPKPLFRIGLSCLVKSTGVTVLHHGGCRGSDAYADKVARSIGIDVHVHPADWSLGPSAGPMRNREMARAVVEAGGELCFVAPGGRGTASAVKEAQDAGLYVVYLVRGNQTPGKEWNR